MACLTVALGLESKNFLTLPMKILIRLILITLCFSPHLPAEEPPAPATEPLVLKSTDKDGLKAAVGKIATVTGQVQRANAWDGGITFLNLEGGFTIVCFKKNYGKFPAPPDQLYAKDKTIEVTGKIRLHKERPEIEITGPEQVKVLAEAPAPPSEPAAPAAEVPEEGEKNAGEKKPGDA
jgi:hypothetical protein